MTSHLRSKIDALWLDFHSGGITNPITVHQSKGLEFDTIIIAE